MEQVAGFGILVGVLIDIAKKAGIVPDGAAGKLAVWVNAALLALAAFSGALGIDLSEYDALAKSLALLLMEAIALAASVGVHKLLKLVKFF